jgi:uncharacterized protein (TIGR04222 family)
MDWLLHNPVADLSGPAFLVFYVVVLAAAVLLVRMRAIGAAAGDATPPPVTGEQDPARLAYLRGGGFELVRFTLFDLLRRGVLVVVPAAKPKQAGTLVRAPEADLASLTQPERALADFFATPRAGSDVFGSPAAAEITRLGDAAYAAPLRDARLLTTDAAQRSAAMLVLACAVGLLLLSLYRLSLAFVLHHRNVGFLIALTVLAPLAMVLAGRVPRLTARGRSYLDRLRIAYRPASVAPLAAGAAALPLFVAVAGFDALAGTEYAPLQTMFRKSSASCGGGCSSGSSCSGGGSCGGGGGCGG